MPLNVVLSMIAAIQAPVDDSEPRADAVIVARPADEAELLRNCLARHCPPREDIAASMAAANRAFADGEYDEARLLLAAARGRNGKHAKTLPTEVARLHGMYSRVSQHLGYYNATWNGRLAALSAVKAGLPDDHPQVLFGRLYLGDTYQFSDRPQAALEVFAAVAKRARTRGLLQVEGAALTRQAALLVALAAKDSFRYRRKATTAVDALMNRQEPDIASYATAARTLKVQLAALDSEAAIDEAIATFRPAQPAKGVQLLYAPAISLSAAGAAADTGAYSTTIHDGAPSYRGTTMRQVATADYDKQWIDVAFEIAADGRVGEVRIQRQSPELDGNWTNAVLASIARRRYAPMRIEGDDRVARLERFTFTSLMEDRSGSRLLNRDAKPVLQMVDLSG